MRAAVPGATFDFVQVNAAALWESTATIGFEAWRDGAQVATYSVAVTNSASVTAQLPGGFAYVDEVRVYCTAEYFALDDFIFRHHAPPP